MTSNLGPVGLKQRIIIIIIIIIINVNYIRPVHVVLSNYFLVLIMFYYIFVT